MKRIDILDNFNDTKQNQILGYTAQDFGRFPTEISHFPKENAAAAVHINLVADLMAKTPIHRFGWVMTHKAKANTHTHTHTHTHVACPTGTHLFLPSKWGRVCRMFSYTYSKLWFTLLTGYHSDTIHTNRDFNPLAQDASYALYRVAPKTEQSIF